MVSAINEVYAWVDHEVCPSPPASLSELFNKKRPLSRIDVGRIDNSFRKLPLGETLVNNYEATFRCLREFEDRFNTATQVQARFNDWTYVTYDDFFTAKAPELDKNASAVDMKGRQLYFIIQTDQVSSTMLHKSLHVLNLQDFRAVALRNILDSMQENRYKENLDRIVTAIIRSNNDCMGQVMAAILDLDSVLRQQIVKTSDQFQSHRIDFLIDLPLKSDKLFDGKIADIRQDIFNENNRAVLKSLQTKSSRCHTLRMLLGIEASPMALSGPSLWAVLRLKLFTL